MNNDVSLDLICFSHLRWNFVYQRPQHLMSRYPGRVFFIEEPVFADTADWINVHYAATENVRVITPRLDSAGQGSVEERLAKLIDNLVETESIKNYMLWYYSPMALKYSRHLDPELVIYDCMDELSAFKFAPPELLHLEKELFAKADVVFTGGNSLFNAKKKFHDNLFAFPSSIDKAHFVRARHGLADPPDQENIPHPRLGFYGVLDERLDVNLVDELARLRPDWQIVLIGPVVKIDPSSLPKHQNIHYLGPKSYDELPVYLSGWDIAIMPFAMNESTTFISPTKTPEYLCAGKQVISTPIADVVNDYAKEGLVYIGRNAGEFILAAKEILRPGNKGDWLQRVDSKLAHNSWNATWEQMYALMMSTLVKNQQGKKNIAEK
jgi:hypothetical protein